MKKKKDNSFGGNYMYTKTIRPNTNYGKFVDRNGNIGDHKFIKLVFTDRDIIHQEGSKTVVCNLSGYLWFNIPDYWQNGMTFNTDFSVKGIAVCADDDKFNLDKGIAIASAKAENEAYKVARKMLVTLRHQMKEFANCLVTPTLKFDLYIDKNKEFIDKVVDDEIKVKIKG